eukprot:11499424-Heterocapsa_arctica.AAC.1
MLHDGSVESAFMRDSNVVKVVPMDRDGGELLLEDHDDGVRDLSVTGALEVVHVRAEEQDEHAVAPPVEDTLVQCHRGASTFLYEHDVDLHAPVSRCVLQSVRWRQEVEDARVVEVGEAV